MAVKKVAIFAGTFDPFTLGHLTIVKKALKTFSQVIILVAINDKKKPYYSLEKRIKFIKLSTKELEGVKVDSTKGLTVEYAKKHKVNVLVRGIRNEKDYQYETKMSKVNMKLAPNIKTITLKVNSRYKNISSTKVRELRKKGENLSPYVSKVIIKYL